MKKKENNISKYKYRIIILILLIFIIGICTYRVGFVFDSEPTPMDLKIQNFFLSLRCPVLDTLVCYFTHLGDKKIIIGVCVFLLLLKNRTTYGIPVSISSLVSASIYTPLKHLVGRARPDKALRLITQSGYSFPSGHSAISIACYGLLLYLVIKNVKDKRLKIALSIVLGILSFGLGLSRIYVGVHWPTDVICGWAIGGVILILTTIFDEIIRHEDKWEK